MQAIRTEQKPPRILIIDDNFFNRRKLTRAVKNLGYQAEAVDGGKAALSILEYQAFDAILLDIIMPEMDGF
ncbi:MAG: response regulator, partial [Thiolinea sp.]